MSQEGEPSMPLLEVGVFLLQVALFELSAYAWSIVWKHAGQRVVSSTLGQRFAVRVTKPVHRRKLVKNAAALMHSMYMVLHAFPFSLSWSMMADDELTRHCRDGVWRSWPPVFLAGFVGFLWHDFREELQIARSGIAPLPLDTMLHHIAFGLLVHVQLCYERGCWIHSWLSLTEASTVLSLLRWFAIAGGSRTEVVARLSVVFVSTFFVLRIIVFGAGVAHFSFGAARESRPVFYHNFTLCVLLGGVLINLFWLGFLGNIAIGAVKLLLKAGDRR